MNKLRKSWPYLTIVGVAIIVLLSQIVTGAYILGVDSIFHMNRFYDTMMQIKTGNWSYFISIYGFQQSGRIINALYGPLTAYVNGLLLLITGSWARFQIISSLSIMIISGISMYRLALRTQIKRIYAVIVGISYMLSFLIMGWVVGMQFTGWGAALLPWLISAGFDMVDYQEIKVLKLALPMSVLLQTHMLSSLSGALALVPLFISGIIRCKNRWKMLIHAFYAVLLTLLLTANVWYGTFEISITNHALGVAPQLDMHEDSVALFGKNVFVLSPIYTIAFILVAIYFIKNFKKLTRDRKVIFITGMMFLWLSSVAFPWQTLDNIFPNISFLIQMPRRFVVIAFIFLLICMGIMINDAFVLQPLKNIKYALLIIGGCILIFNAGSTVLRGVNYFLSPGVVQNDYNVYFVTDDMNKLRKSLTSSNPKQAIQLVAKATPDYLPAQYHMTAYNYFDYHPYGSYYDEIINYQGNVQKSIKDNGHLLLTWRNSHHNGYKMQLPVVQYPSTHLILNGKHVDADDHTEIGSVIIRAKHGINRLEIYYHARLGLLISVWTTLIAWILLSLWISGMTGYKLIQKNKRSIS